MGGRDGDVLSASAEVLLFVLFFKPNPTPSPTPSPRAMRRPAMSCGA
jgi:hypothetical protein